MRAFAAGLAAGILLIPALPVWGQTAAIQKKVEQKLKDIREAEKKEKLALEGILAAALKHNPDLHVAEAKVRTAEAERDQLRLKLMQEITVAHAELQRARAAVAAADDQLAQPAFRQGEKAAHLDALQQAKANLAAAEAKLAYLVGKSPPPDAVTVRTVINLPATASQLKTDDLRLALPPKVEGTMAERLRKALAMPFTLDAKDGVVQFNDAVDILREKLKGINVVAPQGVSGRVATIQLTEAIPLGSALQFLEEEYNVRFVLRDYGIRVVDAEEQMPPGALLVVDYWKQHRDTGSAGKEKKSN